MKNLAVQDAQLNTTMEPVTKKENTGTKKPKEPAWASPGKLDYYAAWLFLCMWFSYNLLFHPTEALVQLTHAEYPHEKAVLIFFLFLCNTICFQVAFGKKSFVLALGYMLITPARWSYMAGTFALHLTKTLNTIVTNFPKRQFFLYTMPILYVLGLYSTEPMLLKIVYYAMPFHIILALIYLMIWAFAPLRFLGFVENFLENDFVDKVVRPLLARSKDDEGNPKDPKETVEILTRFLVALFSEKVFLPWFIFVLFTVSAHIIFGGAIFLRTGHLLSENGYFAIGGAFKGSITDYMYISSGGFFGSEIYDITFATSAPRWCLRTLQGVYWVVMTLALKASFTTGAKKLAKVGGKIETDVKTTLDEEAKAADNLEVESPSPSVSTNEQSAENTLTQ